MGCRLAVRSNVGQSRLQPLIIVHDTTTNVVRNIAQSTDEGITSIFEVINPRELGFFENMANILGLKSSSWKDHHFHHCQKQQKAFSKWTRDHSAHNLKGS